MLPSTNCITDSARYCQSLLCTTFMTILFYTILEGLTGTLFWNGGKGGGGAGGGGKLLTLSFSKFSMFGSGRCCPTDSPRKSKRGGDGGGSKPPLVLLLLLLLFSLLKNSLPSWSLLNLDLSSKSLVSGALSKNLLQSFFLPELASSIKEPISGFCTSKCFTCLNKS